MNFTYQKVKFALFYIIKKLYLLMEDEFYFPPFCFAFSSFIFTSRARTCLFQPPSNLLATYFKFIIYNYNSYIYYLRKRFLIGDDRGFYNIYFYILQELVNNIMSSLAEQNKYSAL